MLEGLCRPGGNDARHQPLRQLRILRRQQLRVSSPEQGQQTLNCALYEPLTAIRSNVALGIAGIRTHPLSWIPTAAHAARPGNDRGQRGQIAVRDVHRAVLRQAPYGPAETVNLLS